MPQPDRRLAIIGYGKMGQLIEQLAPGYGFTVALKLDEFNNTSYEGVTAENFRGIDVAVDFSIPAAVVENVERIAALGVNIVVGTTGWAEHADRVKAAVRKNDGCSLSTCRATTGPWGCSRGTTASATAAYQRATSA